MLKAVTYVALVHHPLYFSSHIAGLLTVSSTSLMSTSCFSQGVEDANCLLVRALQSHV